MNKYAQAVRDYWREVSFLVNLDPEVLQETIDTLDDSERKALLSHRRDSREFTMHKVFNRYSDICSGRTLVDDGEVVITTESAITELDISLTTLLDCNKHAIYRIDDLGKEILPSLDYASIQEATAALQQCMEE